MIAGNHHRSRAAGTTSPEATDLSPQDLVQLPHDQMTDERSDELFGSSSEEETVIQVVRPVSPPAATAATIMTGSPTSPSKHTTANNNNSSSSCVSKILSDSTTSPWGPLGRPVASHTDVTATFHDVQHSFMKRISITNVTIRFALQFRTDFGQTVRIVGSIPMLGNWSAARAPQMTWTEGDIWVLDLPVPIAFHRDHGRPDSILQSEPDPMLLQFEYKYVITNSTGTGESSTVIEPIVNVHRWEEGPNHAFAISESSVIEKMNTCPCTIWDQWRT